MLKVISFEKLVLICCIYYRDGRGSRREYRDYDPRNRRDRYSPARHEISPPMKRMRRDWYTLILLKFKILYVCVCFIKCFTLTYISFLIQG